MVELNFDTDPFKYYHKEGIDISFHHTNNQLKMIEDYKNQYGTTLVGLGRILSRANIERLFLTIHGTNKKISNVSSTSSVRF